MASLTRDQLLAALSCVTPDADPNGAGQPGTVEISVAPFIVVVDNSVSALTEIEGHVADFIAAHALPADTKVVVRTSEGEELPLTWDGTFLA